MKIKIKKSSLTGPSILLWMLFGFMYYPDRNIIINGIIYIIFLADLFLINYIYWKTYKEIRKNTASSM